MPGRRLSGVQAYTPAADICSTDCFAEASTMRAAPMTPSTSRSDQKSSALDGNFESQYRHRYRVGQSLSKCLQGRRSYFVFNCCPWTTAQKRPSLSRFALRFAMHIPNRQVARQNLRTD